MKNTQLALLRTAARLFAEKGFSGTSIRHISQTTGANISAVHYYFGDKRGLFFATIEYLIKQNDTSMFGRGKTVPSRQELQTLTPAQTKDLLRQVLEQFLEMRLSRRCLALEHIFAHAKLEKSVQMREILLKYTAPFDEMISLLLARLTGLKPESRELLFLTHTIFGQLNLPEHIRFVILHTLGLKEYTPEVREEIKKIIWQNTLAILNSYEKRNEKR